MQNTPKYDLRLDSYLISGDGHLDNIRRATTLAAAGLCKANHLDDARDALKIIRRIDKLKEKIQSFRESIA